MEDAEENSKCTMIIIMSPIVDISQVRVVPNTSGPHQQYNRLITILWNVTITSNTNYYFHARPSPWPGMNNTNYTSIVWIFVLTK